MTMPQATRWIDLGDVSLRYEMTGAGDSTLLLMHEMGGTLESWEYVVHLLAPHMRVVRYDARGAGLSEQPSKPITIEDLSRDAARLLDAVGIEGPVTVAGCAVGAANALHFASVCPEHIRGVVAISPAMSVAPGDRSFMLERSELIKVSGPRAIVDSSLAFGYPPVLRSDDTRFENTRGQRISASPSGFAETYRMLVDLQLDDALPRITAPVLLVACGLDQNVPVARVESLRDKLPTSRIMTIGNAGHFAPVQASEIVARAIEEFVGSLP